MKYFLNNSLLFTKNVLKYNGILFIWPTILNDYYCDRVEYWHLMYTSQNYCYNYKNQNKEKLQFDQAVKFYKNTQ